VPQKKNIFTDNEFTILSEIAENETITQRELSQKLGVSLGSINVLMNKMVREGLIKMEQVSQRQVLYMLTPRGMMEKAKKTVSYLKAHYKAIYSIKEKIKNLLGELETIHDQVFILIPKDEMGEIAQVAVHEYVSQHKLAKVQMIKNVERLELKKYSYPVLVHMNEHLNANDILMDLRTINLLESL
jgi:DNA-binding MarR family transcriptional regulator